MILYTVNSYANTRKDGKIFYHETKEAAFLAAASSKPNYESIGVHSSFNVLRCDPCKSKGATKVAFKPHTINGVHHCEVCFELANKQS